MTTFLADGVTPADPVQGQLVVGLWLMAAIAAGSLVAAVVLWRIGRRSSGQPRRGPLDAGALGSLAVAFAVALLTWAVIGWLTNDDQGSVDAVANTALNHVSTAFGVLIAAGLAVTGVLYLIARLRGSRNIDNR